MEKPNVFATRPLPATVLEFLEPYFCVTSPGADEPMTTSELAVLCRDRKIEGLLSASGTPITAALLEMAPTLRMISHIGKGVDHIDLAACTARGVLVTNGRGAPEEATADMAFALILAVARRVVEADRFVREGHWHAWGWSLFWGANVYGKTLGLFGFGAIGQAMARRAAGFSMRILYTQRHRAPASVERDLKSQYAEPDMVIREADFLSLHVPLTAETRHLISAPELSRMKPTAFLINTSRGPVVDEEALVSALKHKQIAGAALDVFENEPRVHPELLAMPNTVLMPHLGSATAETRTRMAMQAAENLVAAFDGKMPPNALNPEALQGEPRI